MDKIELLGGACFSHGPYTFYKAARIGNGRVLRLGSFFLTKLWSDADLVSIGELQLLWMDSRGPNQPLASLRLYFLPENTPDGRRDTHGEALNGLEAKEERGLSLEHESKANNVSALNINNQILSLLPPGTDYYSFYRFVIRTIGSRRDQRRSTERVFPAEKRRDVFVGLTLNFIRPPSTHAREIDGRETCVNPRVKSSFSFAS